jgi:hypothetical protein
MLRRALREGLHLVTGFDVPGEAPEWTVQVHGMNRVVVATRDGLDLFDGELTLVDHWLEATAHLGCCLLFVGTGLRLTQPMNTIGEVIERMEEVAKAGRLVGGLVSVVRV